MKKWKPLNKSEKGFISGLIVMVSALPVSILSLAVALPIRSNFQKKVDAIVDQHSANIDQYVQEQIVELTTQFENKEITFDQWKDKVDTARRDGEKDYFDKVVSEEVKVVYNQAVENVNETTKVGEISALSAAGAVWGIGFAMMTDAIVAETVQEKRQQKNNQTQQQEITK